MRAIQPAAPPTETPAETSPNETAEQARATFMSLFDEARDFVSGVLALDPQEALLRAGLSILVLIGALLILYGVRVLLRALADRIAPPAASNEKEPPFSFRKLTGHILRIAVALIAILAVLQIWGVDLADIFAGPVGGVLALAGRAALIVVVMLATVELANTAIKSLFSRVAARARGPRRAAQLRTIAPVVSGVVTSVLFVITAMMVLAQIGVEIGPLLAGAGIVGLAVGFGAQTLVKDFLTGLFLIVEDVVSIGDIVTIGEASGVVEDMSLRTIKLRAYDGTLQVIPYGEAQIVFNMTKDFSFAVFNISISYSSDITRALELMQQTGDELKEDPAFSGLILAPIEISGVDQLADSGVILKGRLKTIPTQQWTVGREYLKRIKLAFDAHGVEIPFPHLKIVLPDQPSPVDETRSRAAE